MSTTILRMIFAAVFAITGFLLGRELFTHLISLHVANQLWLIALTLVVPVLGAVAGVVLAPLAQAVFESELNQVEGMIDHLTPGQLVGGVIGLLVGLVVAFLIKNVVLEFVGNAGQAGGYVANVFYILLSIFAAYLGARVGAKQSIPSMHAPSESERSQEMAAVPKIIDTSVIVDGRILEIVESGFLEGPLVLPRFVLRELQLIADSLDAMKRTRGRRGLDILTKLQEMTTLEITERDYDDAGGAVDAKLVRLARERGGKLVTNDYNLNRVANVEGVQVLNINELAGAVKPVVLPGEEMHVAIVRDGTMIIVENARRLVGEEIDVQVTSVLQTVAGRMIFAKVKRTSQVGGP
jgi:uncharacterized protein YacL